MWKLYNSLLKDTEVEGYFRIAGFWSIINSVLYIGAFMLTLLCASNDSRIAVFMMAIAINFSLHFGCFAWSLRNSAFAYADPVTAALMSGTGPHDDD